MWRGALNYDGEATETEQNKNTKKTERRRHRRCRRRRRTNKFGDFRTDGRVRKQIGRLPLSQTQIGLKLGQNAFPTNERTNERTYVRTHVRTYVRMCVAS